jgi:adenine-specific DNA methylase
MQLDVESDASFTSFLPGATVDDKACYATFKVEPKLMGFKSHEAGRPVYEDREYVRILVKGQDKQVFWREVTDEDKQRFPNAYAAFKKGVEAVVSGTPVEMLGLGPSSIEMMRLKGIRTVEDLASLGDDGLQGLGMGARELQAKAKAFLGKTSVQSHELEQALAVERAKTAAMQAQMQAMQAQVAKLLEAQAAPVVKRRGRPPGRPRKEPVP